MKDSTVQVAMQMLAQCTPSFRGDDLIRAVALADAIERNARNEMAVSQNLSYGSATIFNLFEPGKRNPVPTLLLGRNPDGTLNLVKSDGNNGVQFVFNCRSSAPYRDDASVPYAVPATVS